MRRLTALILALCPLFAAAQAVSPDLSAIDVAASNNGKTLITKEGTWNFGPNVGPGGNEILLNGNGSNGGQATLIQVGDGGKMFAHAADNSWWVWTVAAGWNTSPGTPTTVTCIPPTTYTDGATITQHLTFTFYRGTGPRDFTTDVVTESNECKHTWYGLLGAQYFSVTAKDPMNSESALSAQLGLGPLQKLPQAPTSLIVKSSAQVFAVKQTKDHLATTTAVGTVSLDTPCDTTQRVNDMFVVSTAKVTWYGNVRPQVVVARCVVP